AGTFPRRTHLFWAPAPWHHRIDFTGRALAPLRWANADGLVGVAGGLVGGPRPCHRLVAALGSVVVRVPGGARHGARLRHDGLARRTIVVGAQLSRRFDRPPQPAKLWPGLCLVLSRLARRPRPLALPARGAGPAGTGLAGA